jgi:hypothetical protein
LSAPIAPLVLECAGQFRWRPEPCLISIASRCQACVRQKLAYLQIGPAKGPAQVGSRFGPDRNSNNNECEHQGRFSMRNNLSTLPADQVGLFAPANLASERQKLRNPGWRRAGRDSLPRRAARDPAVDLLEARNASRTRNQDPLLANPFPYLAPFRTARPAGGCPTARGRDASQCARPAIRTPRGGCGVREAIEQKQQK